MTAEQIFFCGFLVFAALGETAIASIVLFALARAPASFPFPLIVLVGLLMASVTTFTWAFVIWAIKGIINEREP